jgi:hypothetical protein
VGTVPKGRLEIRPQDVRLSLDALANQSRKDVPNVFRLNGVRGELRQIGPRLKDVSIEEILHLSRGDLAGTAQASYVSFEQRSEVPDRRDRPRGGHIRLPSLQACDLRIDALSDEIRQHPRFDTSLIERKSRVLPDRELAAQISASIAECPDASMLASSLRTRDDESTTADW